MNAASGGSVVIPTPRRTHVVHGWITAFAYDELRAEADRRRMHPDALAARILERALFVGMTHELLD